MQLECGDRVTFSAQMPMFVSTAMSKQCPSMTVPTAKAYARAAIGQIGHAGITSPYWIHAFQVAAMRFFPWSITSMVVGMIHKDIRKRALRKKAKLAKQK